MTPTRRWRGLPALLLLLAPLPLLVWSACARVAGGADASPAGERATSPDGQSGTPDGGPARDARWLLDNGRATDTTPGDGRLTDAQADASTDGSGDARRAPRLLRDPLGRAVIYRGVNVMGRAKSAPDHLAPVDDTDFARLASWGVTLTRLLVFWQAIEPEPGRFDDAYLDAVAARVRLAEAHGIDVLLDLHQDLFGAGFGAAGAPRWACPEENYATYQPQTPWFINYFSRQVTACFDHLWQTRSLWDHYRDAAARLAARLGGEPAVVGLDLMNEPFFGSHGPDDFEPLYLAPFYEHVAAGVRAVAPGLVLYFEPSLYHSLGLATALPRPSFAPAVFAPHYYPAFAESGAAYPGNPAAVQQALAAMADEAAGLGVAWMLGEFGMLRESGGALDYLGDVYDTLDQNLAGGTQWSYDRGSGMCLLDRNGAETGAAQVLTRMYAHRVAGTPLGMALSGDGSQLGLSWAEDGARGPTEIVVPARLGAQGVAVESSDAAGRWSSSYRPDLGRVLIEADRAEPRHAVWLRLLR